MRKIVLFVTSFMIAMLPVLSFASEAEIDTVRVQVVKEGQSSKVLMPSENLKQCGTISYQEKLIINNTKQELYPTFEDPENAITKITKMENELLSQISSQYQLKCFDKTTWNDYYNILPEYEEYVETQYVGADKDGLLYKQIPQLYEFFDIYENAFANDEIIQEVKKVATDSQKGTYHIKKSKLSTIGALLPETATLKTSATPKAAFNKSKAIEYAKNWATKYNPQYPKYSSGDCANFASQIKLAGGTKMTHASSGNVKKGWWYLRTTRGTSNSWRLARDFTRYFGRSTYTGSSFKTFSSKITAGRFIGYDTTKDGDVDHIGFVTAKNNKLKTTEGVTYYNFKVAQHSGMYHAWVSSKDNGWDALHKKYPKISYTIIG